MGQHGRQKFRRMVALQLRGLVGLQPVSRGMRAAERIAAELHEQIPHRGNLDLVPSFRPRRRGEFLPPCLHLRHAIFHQHAPQNIRAPRVPTGEHLANLQHMFLVSHHAIGRTQHRLQTRMHIRHRLCAPRPPRELFLAQAVGRARTDHRHDGNQLVDGPHPGHPRQRCHGRTLDMVRPARLAVRDHLPHMRIVPASRIRRIDPPHP